MPSLDVAAARAVTPGCADLAFLNNAGAALPTQRTVDAVIGHLQLESRMGAYWAQDAVADRLATGKALAAQLLNASGPDEIAYAASDSVAFNKVFWGLIIGEQVVPGDRILVDRISYNSHYLSLLQAQERFDLRIDVLPSHPDGSIDVAALDGALDDDVTLVSATMVGTHCGLVNPVADIGSRCRARGILFVLDACQGVGQLPVDVQAIGCDALTTTGRKWLRAPRGTGLLWVHRDVIGECVPIGIDATGANWADEDHYELAPNAVRFQEFEIPVASFVGMVSALEQVGEIGIDAIHSRISTLADRLRSDLAARAGVVVHDGAGPRSGIVTFSVAGRAPAEVVAAAREAGIAINVSSAPWARLDMDAKGLTAVVRASPHYYNDDDELDRLLSVVDGVLPT